MAPPLRPASSDDDEEDMSASYSTSQDREAADKDTKEAVVQQPLSAVARSSPAIPKNQATQPQGTASSSEEEDDDDEEEVDLQPSKSADHPVTAKHESEESDSSYSDSEPGGSPNKDAAPDELARSSQKRAKAPAQHRGEGDGDPSDEAPQPRKTKAPSAGIAKPPQKSAKAPAQHRGEEDGDPSDQAPQPKKTKAPSAGLTKSPQKRKKAPAQHRGEEDGDPSDKARQPKKTKAPSAGVAMSPQKGAKAPAQRRGEEDGDPSDKAPQQKNTNAPSAELAKSSRPNKKTAPAQQLGEEEVQTADWSNSESGDAAPDAGPRPKRNAVHKPAAPKRRRKTAPQEPKSKKARRTWSPPDETLILEALVKHCREHGGPPPRSDNAFFVSLAQRLEDQSWQHNEIKDKMSSLKRRYQSNSVPTTDHELLVYNLSNVVWGDKPLAAAAAAAGVENGGEEHRGFEEMCELYPHLAQEVKVLTEAQPAVKRSFPRLGGSIARAMEAKLEKVAWAKVKMQVKIKKELVNLLMELS